MGLFYKSTELKRPHSTVLAPSILRNSSKVVDSTVLIPWNPRFWPNPWKPVELRYFLRFFLQIIITTAVVVGEHEKLGFLDAMVTK